VAFELLGKVTSGSLDSNFSFAS